MLTEPRKSAEEPSIRRYFDAASILCRVLADSLPCQREYSASVVPLKYSTGFNLAPLYAHALGETMVPRSFFSVAATVCVVWYDLGSTYPYGL